MSTLTPDQRLRRRRTNRRILVWLGGFVGVVFLLLALAVHWFVLPALLLLGMAVLAYRMDPTVLPA